MLLYSLNVIIGSLYLAWNDSQKVFTYLFMYFASAYLGSQLVAYSLTDFVCGKLLFPGTKPTIIGFTHSAISLFIFDFSIYTFAETGWTGFFNNTINSELKKTSKYYLYMLGNA